MYNFHEICLFYSQFNKKIILDSIKIKILYHVFRQFLFFYKNIHVDMNIIKEEEKEKNDDVII